MTNQDKIMNDEDKSTKVFLKIFIVILISGFLLMILKVAGLF